MLFAVMPRQCSQCCERRAAYESANQQPGAFSPLKNAVLYDELLVRLRVMVLPSENLLTAFDSCRYGTLLKGCQLDGCEPKLQVGYCREHLARKSNEAIR